MKKFLSIVLAMIMTLAMATSVFASDAANVTITGGSGTFEAYQIFTGTISDGKLVDIKWGNGISDEGKTALAGGTTQQDAAKLASTLATYTDDDTNMRAFADNASAYLQNPTDTTALAPGYYLIKNATVGTTTGATRFIVKVVGDDISIQAKATDIPVPGKTVDDSDADINQTLNYTITATLPTSYTDYKKYHLVMTDTMSAGITFDEITSVTYGETTIDASNYTTNENDIKSKAGQTLKVDFANLKTITGITSSSVVTVKYKAHLNENAVIDQGKNGNDLKLQYTNDPNYNGTGTEPYSETTTTSVNVSTYALAIQKVDENGDALKGATFTVPWTVTGKNGKYTVTGSGSTTIATDDNGLATIKGMASGSYNVQEASAPTGYNKKEGDISVTAQEYSNTKTTTETTTFYDEKGNVIDSSSKASTETTYTDKDIVAKVTVIENHSGSILPSTGGIGTTIFYVIGGILVIGAGVVLVARKRTQNM